MGFGIKIVNLTSLSEPLRYQCNKAERPDNLLVEIRRGPHIHQLTFSLAGHNRVVRTFEIRAPDKVLIFISEMPIS